MTARGVQNIIATEEKEAPTTKSNMLQLTDGRAGQSALTKTGSVLPVSTVASSVPNLLASTGVATSASDLEKISSVDCFALTGAHVSLPVVQEALIQAIQLYRSFVAKEKYDAAKQFAQHLQERMWEHHIFAIMQQQEQKQLPLPPLWQSLDREYGHWRVYIKCLNWYQAWLEQHGTKPVAPTFHPHPSLTQKQAQAEYAIFQKKYHRFEQEMEAWRTSQHSTVTSCLSAFTELFECDGGWLQPVDGALRTHELQDLRFQCIPRLVSMAMQICIESERTDLCLPLASTIASPHHNLHQCFTHDQLRSLLQQFRHAFIATHLKQPDDGQDSNDAQANVNAQHAM